MHRYGFPRTDLDVTLDGVTIKPALALGGWVAFKPMHGGAMVMGDLVLLQTEVNPVMQKLLEGGLEVTAIHNHLLRSTSHDHVHARRRARRSGKNGNGHPRCVGVKRHAGCCTTSGTPAAPPAIDLDTAQLDQIIGVKGQANGGVYQFGVRRRDPITEGGMLITPPGPMGVATAINFQPTGGGKAAITGDFVLTGNEVNPVMKALTIEWHRGHRHPQPHADRRAAADLHALLGER